MAALIARITHTLADLARAGRALFGRWLRRYQTRRLLRELDARRLDALGLTRRDRTTDAAKWFWEK